LGSLPLSDEVREAAELVIGNLNEDGYLTASDEELLAAAAGAPVPGPPATREVGQTSAELTGAPGSSNGTEIGGFGSQLTAEPAFAASDAAVAIATATVVEEEANVTPGAPVSTARITAPVLREAMEVVRQLDPVGVACRDLRECLLTQLKHHQQSHHQLKNGEAAAMAELLVDAIVIVDKHLKEVQNKQHKEIARAIGRPLDAVLHALEFIKTLDPRPGQRYNNVEPRLIEPDVAFVKQGDEYLVLMNEDDVPQLRLNPAYKRLLNRDAAEKDVRNYVKERYKSAIQLIKNIEQRKQTILKVCYAIIGRQRDFLDRGIDQLKPMMIKEVAEEIGVHPSTVSRAVANKYAHTPQGVFELRYFFSESVNGPEGGATSLLILKRRVKKLIEEEDPARPLTDEQITRILQSQGIQVTRRTVAKYREDMRIPSTHQRRVKN
jgi:RNA polymerase sigma-54 factor